jgi:hypothetical protein
MKVNLHKLARPSTWGWSASRRLAPVAAPVLASLEKRLARRFCDTDAGRLPPVFIIGAPRTGSTIFYQVMTHFWDVAYVNNLDCVFHQEILSAALLSRNLVGDAGHGSFTAWHGRTSGWHAPSECGQLWYRWFPADRHYVAGGELDAPSREEMRRTVRALAGIKQRPIVFKNMNCGQRLQPLAEVFPDALFLHCRRDPLYVAQSLIESRERAHQNRDKWWSIRPKEYERLRQLTVPEQVVAQVYFIEQQIESDLRQHFRGRSCEVGYEAFCSQPDRVLDEVREFLAEHGVDVGGPPRTDLDFIDSNNRQHIEDATFFALKEQVEHYFGRAAHG